MRNLLLILVCTLTSILASAQTLKRAVPKGSKIFVEAPSRPVLRVALDKLGEWGYWQLSEKKEDADFLIYFYLDKRSALDYNFSAEFINKSGKSVYTTRTINSAKPRGGVEKLIEKRMMREVED